jgi:hypothetical protein
MRNSGSKRVKEGREERKSVGGWTRREDDGMIVEAKKSIRGL